MGGVLVMSGLAVAAVRTRGYPVPPGRELTWLNPWQFHVVTHAARRIAAPDDAHDTSIPTADDVDVVGFVDGWLGHMPKRVQRDLGRFLAYLEHVAPLGEGYVSRFTRLLPQEQDRVLASVQASASGLLRAGFEGVKALVFMGYYRDARTWALLAYDGPLVGRPAEGWR